MLPCSCGKIISLIERPTVCLTQGRSYQFWYSWNSHGWGTTMKASCIFNVLRWTDNAVCHDKERFATLAIPFCNSLLIFLLTNCTKWSFQSWDLPSKFSKFVAEQSGMQLAPSKQPSSAVAPLHSSPNPPFELKFIVATSVGQSQSKRFLWLVLWFTRTCSQNPVCGIFSFAITLELSVSLSEQLEQVDPVENRKTWAVSTGYWVFAAAVSENVFQYQIVPSWNQNSSVCCKGWGGEVLKGRSFYSFLRLPGGSKTFLHIYKLVPPLIFFFF